MNDPNGLIYFNGMYYVFFQWNKFELNHSNKEWGGVHFKGYDFMGLCRQRIIT